MLQENELFFRRGDFVYTHLSERYRKNNSLAGTIHASILDKDPKRRTLNIKTSKSGDRLTVSFDAVVRVIPKKNFESSVRDLADKFNSR